MVAPDVSSDVDAARTVSLTGPGHLSGSLRVPGDKSISHRALLLAGLAEGESLITGLSGGDDVRRTRLALESYGVQIEPAGDGLRVRGGLQDEPDEPLDLGNSGTATRLFAGVCAGRDGYAVLTGDQYLRARPMNRVAVPLRAMGAAIDGRRDGDLLPLGVRGGRLTGIDYDSPVASAQVKSAILLAGLGASGPTSVREPAATRRHTEEMLRDFGGKVAVDGTRVTIEPSPLSATDVDVPGDPSQAAFWTVAALIVPDASVTVENVYLGFGRTGFIDVLRRMGADIDVDASTGLIRARSTRLTGIDIAGADIPSIIDEVPILAVAAAAATGTTTISGAQELRVKESDRIASTVRMLRAFGARAHETEDGMVIEGGAPARGGVVDSHGDHRIAMAACVNALIAEGTTVIHGWDSVATSYPGFAAHLAALSGGAVTLSA
ncbi:3-phosphoshikimate 1-carboxyvinyltransferase 1 [Actinomadura rubteroloni]|uniref:3-phosphoshikimate 1-carboxyvinyltransferase n=1 Tax=Actinomadura rubteroloni TaxID=1926885 RepID=A0A2P4UD87_9ACTN|nr:3-phosphoshikimate 1-carboxyvinyltransferase 1 [Actinomadura rubteroloni]